MRFPRGRRARPRTSRVSTSVVKSSTSTAPCRRRSAENARSEPTTAPVCASAARAAACERPTFRQTTGFPASAQRSSADANSAGRRTVSRKSPIAPVPSSSAKKPRMSAASVTASPPDETTRAKADPRRRSREAPRRSTPTARPPRRGRDGRCPARSPIQSEPPPGAATPMQFGPSSTAPPRAARSAIRVGNLRPCGTGLVPEAREEESAHSRCERLPESLLDAFVPDEEGGQLRLLRKVGDAGETAKAEHLVPRRIARPRRGFPTARSPRRSARAAARHPRRQPSAGRGGVERGCDRPSRAHTILSTREATCTRSRSRSAGATRTPTGHVNNAVYLTYLEEVRDEWLERALGDSGDAWDYVLARVAIDFRRELTQDDDAIVARLWLDADRHVERDDARGDRHGRRRLAAEAEAVLVARDTETGPLPSAQRRGAGRARARARRCLTISEPLRLGPVELPNRIVSTAHQTTLVARSPAHGRLRRLPRGARGGRDGDDRPRGDRRPRVGTADRPHPGRLPARDRRRLPPRGRGRPPARDASLRPALPRRPRADRLAAQAGSGRAVGGPEPALPRRARRSPSAEIDEIVAGYARSAELAAEGGLDGIELSAAHGYLFAQFFTPGLNLREDEWAAGPQLLVAVVEAVRNAAPGLALGVRLSADSEAAAADRARARRPRRLPLDRPRRLVHLPRLDGNRPAAAGRGERHRRVRGAVPGRASSDRDLAHRRPRRGRPAHRGRESPTQSG